MTGKLSMWTVYDHPKDYPNNFVARRFETDAAGIAMPTESVVICPDLDTLRAMLMEMGLTCLTRMEGDDPKIVETWL